MSVTFQPADNASSDISLTVRSFAPNMPIICHLPCQLAARVPRRTVRRTMISTK